MAETRLAARTHAMFAAAFAVVSLPLMADSVTLGQHIQDLATRHDFVVRGIDKLANTPAQRSDQPLRGQLDALLENYDHVILGSPPNVERVIILGLKSVQPREYQVTTTRRGSHHLVAAQLQGPLGGFHDATLVVDTGASTVVLPLSMTAQLGFDDNALTDTVTHTANGVVPAKSARLASVRLQGAEAKDVEVLFLPDVRLGGSMLLGMSFLRNFALTVDDQRNRLVLKPR